MADPGPDVGDSLAGERRDPLERGKDLAVRVDDVTQAREKRRVGIGPGRQDGTHGVAR